VTIIDREAVAALVARARRDVDDGTLPACQLSVGFEGEVIVNETFGAPANSRFVTFSVTKAFSAAIAWLLIGDGVLHDKTRVAEVVPEFAANGKDDVTIEHLLTHTAGFPRAPMRPEEGADREQRCKRLESWRLDWPAGSQTEYHATSAYWALVEVIDRLVDGDYRGVFRDRVTGPLGLSGITLGTPVDAQDDVVRIVMCGGADEGKEGLGDRVAETGDEFLLRFNEPEVLAIGIPGAGAVASAADIALFYQALLHNPGEVFVPDVLADATGNIRNRHLDPLFDVPANRTLGLVVAGDDGKSLPRGFGKWVGPRTFGAMGVGGQIAWADPHTGLSFGYVTNGMDVDVVGSFLRSAKIAGLAAKCAAL
jgi:CubicO group peptidase (beta-lactamase class C family)